MIPESGKPEFWNLVPRMLLLDAGFRASIPTSSSVLCGWDWEGGLKTWAQENKCLAKPGWSAATI